MEKHQEPYGPPWVHVLVAIIGLLSAIVIAAPCYALAAALVRASVIATRRRIVS